MPRRSHHRPRRARPRRPWPGPADACSYPDVADAAVGARRTHARAFYQMRKFTRRHRTPRRRVGCGRAGAHHRRASRRGAVSRPGRSAAEPAHLGAVHGLDLESGAAASVVCNVTVGSAGLLAGHRAGFRRARRQARRGQPGRPAREGESARAGRQHARRHTGRRAGRFPRSASRLPGRAASSSPPRPTRQPISPRASAARCNAGPARAGR